MSVAQHLGLSAFWFANQLHWGALGVVLIQSQSDRMSASLGGGLGKADISGLAFALGSIVAALAPPLVGALSDRSTSSLGRRRPFVISGTLVNVAGLYLMWLAFARQSVIGYVAAFMVVQLGNNIALGAFSGIIPDVVPPEQRGTASGFMAALQQLGTIGGIVGTGLFMGGLQKQDALALALIAAFLIVFGAITVASVREVPQKTAERIDWGQVLRSFWISPRRYPDFAWVWITRALFTAGWWLIQPILLYFLQDVVRAPQPERVLARLGALVLVGATVSGLLGGVLSDRWGRKRIVFLAGMVMAGGALTFALLTSSGLATVPIVFTVAAVWGIGYGAYVSVDWALGTDVLPHPEDAGKDMGVWHLAMVLPQAVSPPLATAILRQHTTDSSGQHYSPTGFALVFLVAMLFLTLSSVFIWKVRKAR